MQSRVVVLAAILCALACLVAAGEASSLSFSALTAEKLVDDAQAMEHHDHFVEFQEKFDRVYDSIDEYEHRFDAFRANLARIQELNEANPEATYGLTNFSDRTDEELTNIHSSVYDDEQIDAVLEEKRALDAHNAAMEGDRAYFGLTDDAEEALDAVDSSDLDDILNMAEFSDITGTPSSSEMPVEVAESSTEEEDENVEDVDDKRHALLSKMPKNFDWRDYQAVTHVKNQGHCGSCWAFAALGNIEGLLKLKAGKPLKALSEQFMVDCDKSNHGCHGGMPARAFMFAMKRGMVAQEKYYPYRGDVGNCKRLSKNKVVGVPQIKSWVRVGPSEDDIAYFLYKHGPLAAALHGRGWLHFYHGGIADPPHCPANLTHGVVIVGYGEEKGKKYWIVRNSWGPLYGEKGYFRLARGKNACSITRMVESAVLHRPSAGAGSYEGVGDDLA